MGPLEEFIAGVAGTLGVSPICVSFVLGGVVVGVVGRTVFRMWVWRKAALAAHQPQVAHTTQTPYQVVRKSRVARLKLNCCFTVIFLPLLVITLLIFLRGLGFQGVALDLAGRAVEGLVRSWLEAGAGRPSEPPAALSMAVITTIDDDNPDPGQVVTFTVVVSNSGTVSATDAVVSDTLPSGLTLAAPVILDPPQAGVTLAQGQADLPVLASGLTISDETRITLTFPVTLDVGMPRIIFTNTAAVTSTEVITPVVGSVRVDSRAYLYLPLVLRDV